MKNTKIIVFLLVFVIKKLNFWVVLCYNEYIIIFQIQHNGPNMKKYIVITLSVILLVAFVIASALGYSLVFPGDSNTILNFSIGLTAFSKMFSFCVVHLEC